MTRRLLLAALCLTSTGALFAANPQVDSLKADLDRVFNTATLARAQVSARIESLGRYDSTAAGRVLYERDADRLVVPASNMKLITIAVAADTLGWHHRYETRLETTGTIVNGTLVGDLIVTGTGDPSIGSPDGGHTPLFLEWADALHEAGIRRVDGRLVGDDDAFDDEGLGAGWAWDNLAAGYSAPVGALTYNENAALVQVSPGRAPGEPGQLTLGPPGHRLEVRNALTTADPAASVDIQLLRAPGTPVLTISGRIPLANPTVLRTAAVDNPTEFFVEALRQALASRGVEIAGGAWDVDAAVPAPQQDGRRSLAAHKSAPLSSLAGHALKVSQNLYAEAFLRTLATASSAPGSARGGREVVLRALSAWGVPPDAVVMYDGSGLSRYNYATASAIVLVLKRVWADEQLRGPFVAGLPVAGRDGSLDLRMRGTSLDRNVQAKTGTLSNVRALSGYAQTAGGEKLVFSIIANHFTAPVAQVDAIMEQALERVIRE